MFMKDDGVGHTAQEHNGPPPVEYFGGRRCQKNIDHPVLNLSVRGPTSKIDPRTETVIYL